jgi:hemerythrin
MTQTIPPSGLPTGVGSPDELHREIFEALADLGSVADREFSACYSEMVAKVEHAFAKEEEWMAGCDFPMLKSHREQHARVLRALHRTHSQAMNGYFVPGRNVVERLLPSWLAFHICNMDMALAAAMQVCDPEAMYSPEIKPASVRFAPARFPTDSA